MEAQTALRLAERDPQLVFPWAEPGSQHRLAIPHREVQDWRRWRVSPASRIRHIRLFGMHEEWVHDGRYHQLAEVVEADGRSTLLTVFPAIGFVAYELLRNIKAVGLQPDGLNLARCVARTWGFGRAAEDQVNYAIQLGVHVGMLAMADTMNERVMQYYRPAPRRTQ